MTTKEFDIINNPEYRRVKRIVGLFEHEGWSDFEGEINLLLDYHKCQIDLACRNPLKPEDLNNLNFHISQRECYLRVLDLKDRLLEEVGVPSPDEDEGVKDNLRN